MALGLPVTCVERLANGRRHRETRNSRRLASPWISSVLDVEESAAHRPTVCLLKTSYLLAPLSLTTEAGRLGSR